MQTAILCYGDSNTWGYEPQNLDAPSINRYPRQIRWPGHLQELLGKDYHIVEEGLNSRTTNLNYQFPPDRNGKTYLPPCLYSHAPLDLVIVALGGNDLKQYFNREASDIRDGMVELIDIIQASAYGPDMKKAPQVIIVPPPIPLPICEEFTDENGVAYFEGAVRKAKELVGLYSNLAHEKSCHFLDISKDIHPSTIDGLHLDQENHQKLSHMLSQIIPEILADKNLKNQ